MKWFYLLVFLFSLFSLQSGSSNEKVTLLILKGEAEVSNSNHQVLKRVSQGGDFSLSTGQGVLLGEKGQGKILYPDLTELKLKPQTQVFLVPEGIKILKGETYIHLRKKGKNFQVFTPTMVAGVRGTRFSVRAEDQKGEVKVFEGKVAVKLPKTESWAYLLVPGEKINSLVENGQPVLGPKTKFPYLKEESFWFWEEKGSTASKTIEVNPKKGEIEDDEDEELKWNF